MDLKMKSAFICYLLAIFILLGFGLSYLLKSEFMPYHSVAVGVPWSDVSHPFRILILGLMKTAGGLSISIAVSELFLLFIPFRKGVAWSKYLIPFIGMLACASALNAMYLVGSNTPAIPPFKFVLVAVGFISIGFLMSMNGKPSQI